MTIEHVTNQDIFAFAERSVNLKREDAKAYRDQVRGLRERLESKLKENPDFALKRMLLSGSLAKGSALKQINDIDVALYVKQDKPDEEMPQFLEELAEILRGLYPNKSPEDITPQDHSVCISFKGTGLDVDIVPISYDGNDDWDGYLYSSISQKWVLTNIDKHLDFISKRKRNNERHFIQIVRLLKYWVAQRKKEDENFRFKSFLIELILSNLADNRKIPMDNYVEALAGFYNYVLTSGLKEPIVFDDYYKKGSALQDASPVQIYDPVNCENNAASGYNEGDREKIVAIAGEAADAVDGALYAITKSETLRYWRKVFGDSFGS